MSIERPGDTKWSSHFHALTNFVAMYSSIIIALESIESTKGAENKVDADMCLKEIRLYEFAFSLHLMKTLLGITHELSVALQKRNQDIVNAIDLVKVSKMRIQEMRCSDDAWNSFLDDVSLFCIKHEIDVPKMDEIYVPPGRSRRRMQPISSMHHFKYELYNTIIDLQLQELNSRFNEVNTELLICVACLNPYSSFATFDEEKLIRFVELYPKDFSPSDFVHISNQLEIYIMDVRSKDEFCCLDRIAGLADKLVIKITITERAFSAMKIIKMRLRNKMDDGYLSDCMMFHIEKEYVDDIDSEAVIDHFESTGDRKAQFK